MEERGIAYRDFGTNSTASCDYPDYAAATCGAVTNGSSDFAILCCGTGVGMSMCANKIKGIRACCCSEPFSAEYTRRHNNANILCLGGRVVGPGLACLAPMCWLAASWPWFPSCAPVWAWWTAC